MSYYRVEAVVLRLRPVGEADVFATLFTRERGKLDLKARGTRKPNSKLAALVQPFCHSRLLVYGGKTIDGIAQGEVVTSFRELHEDLDRFAYASYLGELADAFAAPGEAVPAAFDVLLDALSALAAAPSANVLRAVRHAFEVRLVSILGYEPQLKLCVGCSEEVALPGRRWFFSAAQGGVLCEACWERDRQAPEIPPPVLAALRYLAAARWERVGTLSLSEPAWHSLAGFLAEYIDYRVEKKLPAREFLSAIRKEVSSNGRGADRHAGEN